MTTPRIDRNEKNYLINGAMDLAQRAPLTTVTINSTPGYKALDRFLVSAVGTFTLANTQRSSDGPANTLMTKALTVNFQRNATTAQIKIEQRIESVFSRDLILNYGSLSFYHKFSVAPTSVVANVYSANAVDNFTTKTLLATNTFDISTQLTLGDWYRNVKDSIYNFGAEALNGIAIEFVYNFASATDGSPQYVRLTGTKFSLGEKAQSFGYAGRDFRDEVVFAQRYYEKTYNLDVAPATVTDIGVLVAAASWATPVGIGHNYKFIAQKRIVPSVVQYNPVTGATGSFRDIVAGSDKAGFIELVGLYAAYAQTSAGYTGNVKMTAHYTADAEL